MPTATTPALVPAMPPGGPPVGASRADRLRQVCQEFESLFIYKLLERMRATVPQAAYLHSAQDDIYNTICDQQVAITLARSGGIGLAGMLYRQLAGVQPDPAAAASAYRAQGAEATRLGQGGNQDGASAGR